MICAILLSLSLLAWTSSTYSQIISDDPSTIFIPDFSGGLNLYNNPILIDINEAQIAQNVVLDKSGASVSKRQGYSKINSTKIGDGSNAVNAVYRLEQSNGNKYCVGFSGSTGAYSTDACQTFTNFVSTLTAGNDVNCDSFQDRLYCVNNQYNFYFQGTASINVSAMPANLQYIRVHRNRCFAAGSNSNFSRLYFSALGDCTSWTTATDYIDISQNDGDVITAIGPPLYDMLPIYKKFSTWVLKGVDPNTFTLANVSKEIGALDHRSIANLFNLQLFDSVGPNGGQNGIYGFDGITIREMTKKLRKEMNSLDTLRAITNRYIIQTQNQWQAGTVNPSSPSNTISAVIVPGSLVPSTITFSDNSAATYSAGTLSRTSTSDVVGSVVLSSNVFKDDFSDGVFTGRSNPTFPTWTVNSPCVNADFVINRNTSDCLLGNYCLAATNAASNCEITAPQTSSTGSWTWTSYTNNNRQQDLKIISANTSFANGNGYDVNQNISGGNMIGTLSKYPGNTTICTFTNADINWNNINQYWRVLRNASGNFELDVNDANSFTTVRSSCTGTDNTYTTSSKVIYKYTGTSQSLTNPYFYSYWSTATYFSQFYDTTFSTPIGGPLTVSSTVPNGTTLTYQTRSSTSTVGTWGAWSVVTNLNAIPETQRFVQYMSSFSTTIATVTPRINSTTLVFASTGAWTSPESFLSNNILGNGWGLFQANTTLTGNGALTYSIRSATYTGGTAYQPYSSITSDSTIGISTGAYIQVISTFSIVSATESAQLNSLTFNWTEGASAKSPASGVYQNRYHYGAQSNGGSFNDTIYLLDSNGSWTKWTGVRPRSLGVVNQNFVMGDSTTSTAGFLYQLYSGESDNGTAINSIYQTKDMALGNIMDRKSVNRFYVVASSSPATLTLDVIGDAGVYDNAYSLSLSTGMTYKIADIAIEPPINGNVFSLKVSNNATGQPWTLLGIGLKRSRIGLTQP